MIRIKARTFLTASTGIVGCMLISIQTKGSKFDPSHWPQYLTFNVWPSKCQFSAAAGALINQNAY